MNPFPFLAIFCLILAAVAYWAPRRKPVPCGPRDNPASAIEEILKEPLVPPVTITPIGAKIVALLEAGDYKDGAYVQGRYRSTDFALEEDLKANLFWQMRLGRGWRLEVSGRDVPLNEADTAAIEAFFDRQEAAAKQSADAAHAAAVAKFLAYVPVVREVGRS